MRLFSRFKTGTEDSLVVLIRVHLCTLFFSLIEEARIFFRYYRRGRFLLADSYLALLYFFKNPFQISKQYTTAPYGETPLTTLDLIARECGILSKDVVFDLGSGRGRGVLWLSTFVKCEAHGYDRIAPFIHRAQKVAKRCRIEKAFFHLQEWSDLTFKKATVVYLYGTTLKDEEIVELASLLATLKSQTKVITVSYPLSSFHSAFVLEKSFEASFPWGKTDVFLNRRL